MGYASLRAVLLVGSIVAIRTERRAFHAAFAVVSLAWTCIFFRVFRPVIATG